MNAEGCGQSNDSRSNHGHTHHDNHWCQVSGEKWRGGAGSSRTAPDSLGCVDFSPLPTSQDCNTRSKSLAVEGAQSKGWGWALCFSRSHTQSGQGTLCVLALVSSLTSLADPKSLWTGLGEGGVHRHKPAGDEPLHLPPPRPLLYPSRGEGRSLGHCGPERGTGQGLPGQPANSLLFWDAGQMKLRRDACLGCEDVWLSASVSQRRKQQASRSFFCQG